MSARRATGDLHLTRWFGEADPGPPSKANGEA